MRDREAGVKEMCTDMADEAVVVVVVVRDLMKIRRTVLVGTLI